MAMAKKDYIALAAILADCGRHLPRTQPAVDDPTIAVVTPEWMTLLCVTARIADYCGQRQEFDRARFLKAAGVGT